MSIRMRHYWSGVWSELCQTLRPCHRLIKSYYFYWNSNFFYHLTSTSHVYCEMWTSSAIKIHTPVVILSFICSSIIACFNLCFGGCSVYCMALTFELSSEKVLLHQLYLWIFECICLLKHLLSQTALRICFKYNVYNWQMTFLLVDSNYL